MANKKAAATTSNDWWLIVAPITMATIVGASLSLSFPLLSMIFETRSISGFLVGLNTATAGIAAILGAPFITPAAQRLGVTNLLLILIVIASVAILMLFWIPSFWLTFPVRFVFHVATTGIFILSEYWINAVAVERKRGLTLGIYATSLSMGFLIGPAVLSTTGIEGILPFAICAAIVAFAAPIVVAFAKWAPGVANEGEVNVWKYMRLAPVAMIAVLAFGVSESGLLALFPVYGLRIGFSAAEISTFLVALALGNVVFQIPIGILIDRSNKLFLTLIVATFGFSGALLVPVFAADGFALPVLLFLWGGFIPGLYTIGLAQLGERFKGAELASANAAFIMIYSLGMFVGPPIIGAGMERWQPHGAMWTIAGAFCLVAIFAVGHMMISGWGGHRDDG